MTAHYAVQPRAQMRALRRRQPMPRRNLISILMGIALSAIVVGGQTPASAQAPASAGATADKPADKPAGIK